MAVFEKVNLPKDLKPLTEDELVQLCGELRQHVIDEITKIGGHLAPSLGVVELTVALHRVFDTPTDKIVWDVGHQAYIHKLITGRKDRFSTIRQTDGISGFCKIKESEYDTFGAGHASTSISAAIGMAVARDQMKKDYKVVPVIGDGALTGGMAFEALNNAGQLKTDLLVVLNDNMMSISKNVGALSNYLTDFLATPMYNRMKEDIWKLMGKLSDVGSSLRTKISKIDEGIKSMLVPSHLFEGLGFRYFGPIDGHDLPHLIKILDELKQLKGPLLLHILTKKGKGLELEEHDVEKYHANARRFHASSGTPKMVPTKKSPPSYTDVFGKTVLQLCKEDEKIVAITAAMEDGTGLKYLHDEMPDRFFDVGIAEQHATTFAAGLSTCGMKPILAIYSTFLQRAFDQIVHDVAIQKLPVFFVLDRAGLVGADGPTHHGGLDLSYLRCIPDMVVMAPKDEAELQDMLYTGTRYDKGPIAVRFPRGSGPGATLKKKFSIIEIGKAEIMKDGHDVALLGIGKMVSVANVAAEKLEANGISTCVVNARFVKPLDEAMLQTIVQKCSVIITLEDNVIKGGFGSAVLETMHSREFLDAGSKKHSDFRKRVADAHIERIGLPDQFVEHGETNILFKRLGMDADAIAQRAATLLFQKNPLKFEKSKSLSKKTANVS